MSSDAKPDDKAPFLALRGVSKRFGEGDAAVPARADVSLEVAAGSTLVVLGPTGAGKTTLLRLIAGLETPDSGTIELGGRDAAPLGPAERDVALVFQNFSLYPHLTVRGNLAFPLRAPGQALAPAAIRERVNAAAELLRITALLDRPAKHLSGGEMQRVAIGRALVRRPKLFLLDEPLTNLDAKLREALRAELARIFRELAVPVVYVTHDQAEALSLGDRIAVLSKGRVLQVGSPRDIYLRPASPEIARQLGQPPINLFAVTRRGDSWVTADGTPLARATGDAMSATLGIRPEAIGLTGGDRTATVRVVEEAGPHRVVLAELGGAPLHVVIGREVEIAPGATIHPRFDPAQLCLWPT